MNLAIGVVDTLGSRNTFACIKTPENEEILFTGNSNLKVGDVVVFEKTFVMRFPRAEKVFNLPNLEKEIQMVERLLKNNEKSVFVQHWHNQLKGKLAFFQKHKRKLD